MILRLLPLMAKNGMRDRRRSALTVVSIAVSLCLLGALLAMYHALFVEAQANPAVAARLVTHHKVSITQPMPVSYLDKIRAVRGVAGAMVWQWYGGTYKDARDPRNNFARFAIEPEQFFRIRSEVELPDEQKRAFQRERTACIVGRKLALKLDFKPGSRIALSGDIFPVNLELTVAGIYTDPDDSETLFFNYEYLRELLRGTGQADTSGVFMVLTAGPEEVPLAAAKIDKQFENSPAPTRSESERAWQLGFLSFLGDLKLILLSISSALMFAMLLVSANTISMSVRERVREIGVLKTLGFPPGAILSIVLGESALMALAGGAIGVATAQGLCVLVRHSGTIFAALDLAVTPDVALGVMAAAAAIGLAGSAIPAWSASRTPIVDSLRYTG